MVSKFFFIVAISIGSVIAATVAIIIVLESRSLFFTNVFSINRQQDSMLQTSTPLDKEQLKLYHKSRELPVVRAFIKKNPDVKAVFEDGDSATAERFRRQLGFDPKAVVTYSMQGKIAQGPPCDEELYAVADVNGNFTATAIDFGGPISTEYDSPTPKTIIDSQCVE